MYTCPHCGQATFVGSGTCNHCERAFTIAKLEDVFMRSAYAEDIGKRVVPVDDRTAFVVLLSRSLGKKPEPPKITIHEYRRPDASAGWSHWGGPTYDASLAGEIADAVLAITV